MSVTASEIIIYGAANIAENDSDTQGGAISTATRYVFDSAALANAPGGTVSILSDNAGDDFQTVTITGRDSSGSIVNDVLSLNGTNEVDGSQSFERILKIVVSAAHSGTITVQDSSDTLIVDIESGVTTIRRPFYNVSADEAGGSERNFYEKVFVKNTNDTNALLNATIKENADPSSKIAFALEDAVDDNGTSTNRVTAPTGSEIGGTGFDSADKTLEDETDASTTDLAAGSAIGVWLRLTLSAGDSPTKTTWTMEVEGSTT